jgi:HEAT repeat protein
MHALPWKVTTGISLAVAAVALFFALRARPAARNTSTKKPTPEAEAPFVGGASAYARSPVPQSWLVASGEPQTDRFLADLARAHSIRSKCDAIGKLARTGSDAGLRAVVDATMPHQRDEVRLCAAEALGPVEGDVAHERLRALLADTDAAVRTSALDALAGRDDGRADVEARAMAADATVSAPAVLALGRAGAPGSAPRLTSALANAAGSSRQALIAALGSSRDPAALSALVDLANRGTSTDRASAYAALADLGGRAAVGALRAAAVQSHGANEVAIAALSEMDDAEARDVLRELARSGRPERRVQAITGLLRAPETRGEAREACAAMVRDSGGKLASEAIQILAGDPSTEATANLLSLLEQAPGKRAEIYASLASRTDPGALDGLLAIASRGVDLDIVAALATSSDPRVVPTLTTALRGNDATARTTAIGGLAQIPGPEAEAALAEALRSQSPEVRQAAVGSLSARGTPAARALVATLSDDADPQVAAFGAEALLATEGGDAARLTRIEEMWRSRPGNREAVLPLIAALPDAEALPLLTEALRDAKEEVAQAAANQLAALEDPAAERALFAIVDDPNAPRGLVSSVASLLLASGSEAVRARSGDLTRAGGLGPPEHISDEGVTEVE